jgi:hypothetical protein
MTSYDQAVEQGYRCFKNGGSLFHNPYNPVADWFLHQAWEIGFLN